jgi:hypothetical protein
MPLLVTQKAAQGPPLTLLLIYHCLLSIENFSKII